MQPPLQYAVYSKLRSIMTGSEVDKAGIFVDVIYTVWCNSSKFFNQLLALYSKQLAGGEFYNLEAKFVNNIPLPNLTKLDTEYRKILYDNGRNISSVGVVDNKMVESIIMHIYGK